MIGPWPLKPSLKHLGRVARDVMTTGFEAYGLMLLTRSGALTMDQAQRMIAEAFREVDSCKIHSYNVQWCVVGRKPDVFS